MSKKKIVIISFILILCAIGVTVAATLGYYTDHQVQSVVLRAANLDYTITARVVGNDDFNNYSSDIRTIEFNVENHSENTSMAEIGLNTDFMFDKTSDCADVLVYPESVNDTDIRNEIQRGIFTQNYSVNNKKVLFDKITVNAGNTTKFNIKVANKTSNNSGNVLKLTVFAKVFTGNASGGSGFLDDMEDTSGLYYFYNLNTSNNTVVQGVQTITTDDILYSASTYTASMPLVDLTGLGVIENNVNFFDYNGRLSNYGLTLSNGKIYGTPQNMPETYEIRFKYSSANKSWVAKSTETDGTYIGKIRLNFKKSGVDISETDISGVSSQTYTGSEIKPNLTITYNGNTLVQNTDYRLSYANNTNVGTATITIEGIGSYNGTTTRTFTISKANPGISVTPSGKNLIYNGEQQTLINAGTATGGTLYYKLSSYTDNSSNKTNYNNSYSTSMPIGTNAGTYKIEYYVKGDSNHNDSDVSSVNVVISRASFTSTVSISNYTYAGTKSTPSVTNNPGGGAVTYYGRSTSTGTSTNWNSVTSTTYDAGTRYIYAIISATNNYNGYTTSNTSFTINKASFTASVTISGYTYAGTKSTPSITSNPGNGTVTYYGRSISNGTATNWNDVTSTTYDAGTRYIYATVAETTNYYGYTTGNTSFTISKANASIATAPSAKSLTYTGSSQNLVNAGVAGNGTMYYRLISYTNNSSNTTNYNNSYSTSIPTGNSAGVYVVQYYVAGNSNYNDTTANTVSVTINRASFTSSVSISDYVYGGTKSTPSVTNNPGGGTVTYYGRATETGSTTNWNSVTSTTYAVGTRYIYAYIAATNNYNSYTTANKAFSITVGASSLTAPVANTLTYNNASQTLTTTGSTSDGTIYYRLYSYTAPGASTTTYNYSYSTSRPTGTAAGVYVVQYYVKGDSNHSDSAVGDVSVTINARSITGPQIGSVADVTYNGNDQTPSVSIVDALNGSFQTLVNDTDYTLSYSNNKEPGTATITITGKGNYNSSTTKTFTINKASMADVTIGDISVYTYDTIPKRPTPTVTIGGTTLDRINDYTSTWTNNTNAGTATLTITAKSDRFVSGTTKSKNFTIQPLSIEDGYDEFKTYPHIFYGSLGASFDYTGDDRLDDLEPDIKYINEDAYEDDDGRWVDIYYDLIKGTDFDVDYYSSSECVNIGNYTVKITGKNNFTGTIYGWLDISAVDASVTTAPTANTLSYTGSAQTLTTAGSASGGTMYYRLYQYKSTTASSYTTYSNSYSTTRPTGTSAGTYIVQYYVKGDGNHNDTDVSTVTVTISKTNATVSTAPSANTLTYSGSAQTLTTAGTASGGAMYYRLYQYKSTTASSYTTYSNSYSTMRPTGTNAGTYIVQYYVLGDANHNNSSTGSVTVTISKASFTASVSISNYTYAGTKSTPSVTNNPGSGTVTYYGRSTSSGTTTNWSSVTSTTYNAGTRYIYATIAATANYNSYTTANKSFTINKASQTAPTSLTSSVNGTTVTLTATGSGKTSLQYSKDGSTWQSSNAFSDCSGTITFYARYASTTNYNASSSKTVSVTLRGGLWTDSGNYATAFAGGSGTEASPYQIANGAQLARLAYLLNSSEASSYNKKYYVLKSDIDLSAHYWVPIGTFVDNTNFFGGNFNGGGYTISGLVLDENNSYKYAGLFGYVNSANIANIQLDSPIISNNSVVSDSCYGSLCGYCYINIDTCSIENIYTKNPVIESSDNSGGMIGHLYGYTKISSRDFNINNVFIDGGSIQGTYNAGGLIGKMSQYTGNKKHFDVCIKETNVILNTLKNTSNTTQNNSGIGGLVGMGGGSSTYFSCSVSDSTVCVTSTEYKSGNSCALTQYHRVQATRCLVNKYSGTHIWNSPYSAYLTDCYYDSNRVSYTSGIGASDGYTAMSFTTANIKSIINTLGSSEWGTDGTNIFYKSSTLTDHMTLVTLNEVELLSEDVIEKVNNEGLTVDISTPDAEEITDIPTPQPSVSQIPKQDVISPSPSTSTIPYIEEYMEGENSEIVSIPKPTEIPCNKNETLKSEIETENAVNEDIDKDDDMSNTEKSDISKITDESVVEDEDGSAEQIDIDTENIDNDIKIDITDKDETIEPIKEKTSDTVQDMPSSKTEEHDTIQDVNDRISEIISPPIVSDKSSNSEDNSTDSADKSSNATDNTQSHSNEKASDSDTPAPGSNTWSSSLTESSPALSNTKESVKGGDSDAEVD